MKKAFRSSIVVLALAAMIACSTSWVSQAIAIVNAVLPAVATILQIAGQLQGKAVDPASSALLNKWGGEVTTDLNLVDTLFKQYQAAKDAGVKQDLLNQINAALQSAQQNSTGVLSALHITDSATQNFFVTLLNSVVAEVKNLGNIVAAASSGNAKAAKGAQAPLPAKAFKADFNKKLHAPSGNPEVDAAASPLGVK